MRIVLSIRSIYSKNPPLLKNVTEQGGVLAKTPQNPQNFRAFGAILLLFFMNFSYILHVFDTRNDRFSSCVSIFSRLRRTFLPNVFVLQTGTLFETSCTL